MAYEWTNAQVRQLLEMLNTDMKPKEIAVQLKAPVEAIYSKMQSLKTRGVLTGTARGGGKMSVNFDAFEAAAKEEYRKKDKAVEAYDAKKLREERDQLKRQLDTVNIALLEAVKKKNAAEEKCEQLQEELRTPRSLPAAVTDIFTEQQRKVVNKLAYNLIETASDSSAFTNAPIERIFCDRKERACALIELGKLYEMTLSSVQDDESAAAVNGNTAAADADEDAEQNA